VLAYAALPDGLAIWVYDNRGINARWIPNRADGLQELAERFYDLSSDPKSELGAVRRDARSLYAALIAPVEPYLTPGRTLVIEAEGWLARVPFEALLDSNDHYLIERVPIVHSLGQDSQSRLRSNAGISSDLPALVVGSTASSAADGLIPLPDIAAEADAIASDFHPAARVLKGVEATLGAIRGALPGAAVFHFAGHSLATPGRTGLMLDGGNGQTKAPRLMDATVVRQLRLQSLQLAVLSACNTASGSGGSSGFDSVTDALLRAGVPHVVASRWAVDSGGTQRFVQDFYHNALSGQTVSDAIRLASRNMMADSRTSHPYYWSAFAAYGRP
jgi:CHAT domain-containing protein